MKPKNYWIEKWKQMRCESYQDKWIAKVAPVDCYCVTGLCDMCRYNHDMNLIMSEEAPI